MPTATVTIDETKVRHIFRPADGHFPEDTAANRRTLLDVASQAANLVETDLFGNAWFAETRADGSQVWVQVRDGRITNGGINRIPRTFGVSPFRSAPFVDTIQ